MAANFPTISFFKNMNMKYTSEEKIRIQIALYGSISKYLGGHHVAMDEIELPSGASKGDLLEYLRIPDEERGYLFINAVLCDVPGLVTGDGQMLNDGDHVGIFSIDRIWPYQYRDGVNMSAELKAALEIHGAMHHSYSHLKDSEMTLPKDQE